MNLVKLKEIDSNVYENKDEIITLEETISESLSQINTIFKQLDKIERDISNVIDIYYSSNNSSKNIAANDDSFNEESLQSRINSLYFRLSGICDEEIDAKAKDSLSENLDELIKIEQYLSGEESQEGYSPKNKLVSIYKDLSNLSRQLRSFKNSKISIFNSNNEIKSQVMWYSVCVQDLIAKIKKDLSKQIPLVA